MGKYFIRTEHFRQRCQERQISETLLGMIERNLIRNIDFEFHKLKLMLKYCKNEDKILVSPPSFLIPDTQRPYLVLVRNGKLFITAYWICAEKFIKIIQQEPHFYLNLDNPYENSTYIIV